MDFILNNFYNFSATMPVLLLLGLTVVIGLYVGKNMKRVKLPSIIGYMLFGVIIGPSLLNLMNEETQDNLAFITEIALGFVALSIGLELKISSLKKLGSGIIYIIFVESFGAFIVVSTALYFLTGNLPLALIFGAIAPASAPAGTVAIIHEYKAKGSMTKALYAIVGFDDGLGIIIFGFAAAIAHSLLIAETGGSEGLWSMLQTPLLEVLLSLAFGLVFAILFSFLARKLDAGKDVLILIFGFILVVGGICQIFHLSLILTNMLIGMVIVNTQPHALVQKIHDRLPILMPLLFLLFFTLAGAHLHVSALPALGLIGVTYIVTRSAGLILGSRVGAMMGNVEDKIKNWVGLGILSQAGVAIGLSLIVKHELKGIGKVVEVVDGVSITSGDKIGAIVITTVTATSIFFEIIGPILTKLALSKAGEINLKH